MALNADTRSVELHKQRGLALLQCGRANRAQALPEFNAHDATLPPMPSRAELDALAARALSMTAIDRMRAVEWLAALDTVHGLLGEEIASWCDGKTHALS